MKKQDKEQLIVAAAARVHAAWCEEELKAFYGRLTNEMKLGGRVDEMLTNAGLKNGKVRNLVSINRTNIFNDEWIKVQLSTYEGFKKLIDDGVIKVERFVSRNLTDEEIAMAGENYNATTKQENILRPFEKLSADSKTENLQAAESAVAVYEEMSKCNVGLEQLANGKFKTEIGVKIHADWMKRNVSRKDNSPELFVEYAALDEWVKGQDLTVFNAMLEEVKLNKEKYAVKGEKNQKFNSNDVYAEEQEVLEEIFGKKVD